MKPALIEAIQKATSSLGIDPSTIKLEYPENPAHGDYSSNVAMVNAKKLGTAPRMLAEKIVESFKQNKPSCVQEVSIAGPGFINFTLTNNAVSEYTRTILKEGVNFGKQDIGRGKTVLVEYSSPNIAKPFTVGHLRSTIIGDSIATILTTLGYTVIRDNHLGDWGTQFGKLIVALDKWGDLNKVKTSTEPIKELVDLYVRFHDEVEGAQESGNTSLATDLEEQARGAFQTLESDILNGRDNSELVKTWKTCIELSKKEFDKVYARLGVSFDSKRGDTELGESFYISADKSQPVMDQLKVKNILKESEGAQVVFFEGPACAGREKYPPLIIQKSNGASIYATRDLAADWYRKQTYGKKGNLTIINEVGSEQTLYFRQLFEVEKMLGWFTDGERVHVSHGLYRFRDGKMSTRKGNVIWLDDIITEAEARAAKIHEESAHDVALAAIKFNDLKRDSIQDIVFDWDEMMNMTGDSGPYLQYSCVRARAVVEKALGLGIISSLAGKRSDSAGLDLLERNLVRFADVVAFAGESYKPNAVANYLINLAALFNSFYAQSIIADEKDESSAYKVAVTEAFTIVMKQGLGLLGITIPKKM
ncbi:MAG: arginine--tRNA ligase [Candidatus Taylorbacteria bacterium]